MKITPCQVQMEVLEVAWASAAVMPPLLTSRQISTGTPACKASVYYTRQIVQRAVVSDDNRPCIMVALDQVMGDCPTTVV